ncbi:Prp18-domain-containing protein [Jaminaea rosea]|uniref:Pre-mRNA-splicing factor 18 n=1 Tax=Jaminaea rosea TaxID=1569628 RepID=A0A316UYX5_9BASI|nr:Prp18-domain-containing protein [Jaminaea rosea]PWN30486.1 Prp18-domain-containing protein [Jaminaea rosea]
MDILKAELANKRKAASPDAPSSSSSGPASKYVRRGDIEKQREEEARREQEQRRKEKEALTRLKEEERQRKSKSVTPDRGEGSSSDGLRSAHQAIADAQRETFNISPFEASRRLRAKGEPIRLFGETDKETRLRLRALELIEERGEKFGQNDFMRALAGAESGLTLEQMEKEKMANSGKQKAADGKEQGAREGSKAEGAAEEDEKKASRRTGPGIGMDSLLDLDLIRKDMAKVYPIIYYTLKGLLEDWEKSLADRSIEVKMSTTGKTASAIQVQSSEYLKPLFKSLRKRELPPDVLMRIAEIVHYVQKREYRHANDSYLQLSIGNAPWPIGVTMVGIHERSGREKIFASNVAHVLNDEVSRKYIQSLKRLMTFAQTRYPPSDVSMLMG